MRAENVWGVFSEVHKRWDFTWWVLHAGVWWHCLVPQKNLFSTSRMHHTLGPSTWSLEIVDVRFSGKFMKKSYPDDGNLNMMMSKENLLFKYFNFQVLLGCVDLPSSITQEIPQVSPTLQCLSPADRPQVLKCLKVKHMCILQKKYWTCITFWLLFLWLSLLLLLLLLLFSITSYHLYPSTVQWFGFEFGFVAS